LCLRGAFASDGIDIKMILQSCHPYKHIPSTSRPLLDAFACARVASIRTFVESYVHSFLCLRGAFASDGIDSNTIQSCLARLQTRHSQRLAGPLFDAFVCARVASIRTFVESYVHSFLCLRGAFASDGIDSKTIQSCLPPTRLTTILNTGIVSSTTKKVAATQRLAGHYLTFSLVHVWCRSEHS
jgi:hypothetical protein